MVALIWVLFVCLLFTDNFTVNPSFLCDSPDCANHMIDSNICCYVGTRFFVNMNRCLLHNSIDDGFLIQFGMVGARTPWGLTNSNTNYANLLPILNTMV